MTSPVRSVNVDHVNWLMEAVRIGGGFKMEKLLSGGIRYRRIHA